MIVSNISIANESNCTIAHEKFDVNSYETPDRIASQMAKLVRESDRLILEPSAGTGQIAKFLPKDKSKCMVYANEISPARVELGMNNAPHCNWTNRDFLGSNWLPRYNPTFDAVITNPPFDKAMEFIERSLELLNPENPHARLLFLLPVDTFSSVGRSDKLKSLNCHIRHIYLIPGRVDYLKEGVPMSRCQKVIDGVPQFKNGKPVTMSGRQVSDACFEIRPYKAGQCVTFLDEVE